MKSAATFGFLALIVSGCAIAPRFPKVTDFATPVAIQGCETLPPRGPDWYMIQRSATALIFGKKVPPHMHLATLTTSDLGDRRFGSAAEFASFVRSRVEEEWTGPSVRVLERPKVTEDPSFGRFGVRYEVRGEVTGPRGTFGLTKRGSWCLNPGAPRFAVATTYSVGQMEPGDKVAESLEAEAEPMLRSVHCLPVEPPFVTAEIHMRGRDGTVFSPTSIAVGEGAVWVASYEAGGIARIEPRTNSVTALIPVGKNPTGIAVGEGAVWVAVAGEAAVARLDPRTQRIVARIPVGDAPRCVTVGAGAVWVSCSGDASVVRIDPRANKVVATIPIGSPDVPFDPSEKAVPFGLAVVEGSVWVVDGRNSQVVPSGAFGRNSEAVPPRKVGTVVRIAPELNQACSSLRVGSTPCWVAGGVGALWVTNTDSNTVSKIDIATKSVISLPAGKRPHGIAFGAGSAWIVNADETSVMQIVAGRESIVKKCWVGEWPQPMGVAFGEGAAWVACSSGVCRIEPGPP